MKHSFNPAITTCFLAVTAILFTACDSDYRVRSTINTKEAHSLSWTERPSPLNPMRYVDRASMDTFINPYTYNPSDPFAYKTNWTNSKKNDWAGSYFNQWFDAKTNALSFQSYEVTNTEVIRGKTIITITAEATNTTVVPDQTNTTIVRMWRNSTTAEYHEKRSQFLEIFAPIYWKASEAGSITGLTDEERRYYRNDLQNAMLRVIKEATDLHLAALKGSDNRANLILGAAAIGLSSGATVASSQVARALSASAAGAGGARALFNEQIFRNTFVESITALIQKDQAEFLTEITSIRQTNSIYDYTVEAAIRDAKEYEAKGSLYNGLALLQEAVQRQIIGLTNTVPINQLATALPEITAPSSISFAVPTNGIKTNIVITGTGMGLIAADQVKPPGTNLTINASSPSDNHLLLEIQTYATNISGNIEFPYTLAGATRKSTIRIQTYAAEAPK